MGSVFTKLFDSFKGTTERRILMLGLDAAGKTTLCYQLKLGEVVHTIPTIGFNVETVTYKKTTMTLWDVGGQEKIRPLWRHYYRDSDCLIWVVDSNDTDRFEEARDEMHAILNDPEFPRDAVVLVFANKQDLPRASKASTIADEMALESLSKTGRKWYVQPCVASSGDGVYEGLNWMIDTLNSRK